MAGYNDTRDLIINALMGRPSGTEIQPEKHQAYALNMLDYIKEVENSSMGSLSGYATANTIPIQFRKAKIYYLSGIDRNSTITYNYFMGSNGLPITITSGNSGLLIILFWNLNYWEFHTYETSVDSYPSNYGYNIKKTYSSVAEMQADTVLIGDNGLPINIGDIVSVVNTTTPTENGLYSRIDSGWQFQTSANLTIEQVRSQNTTTAPSSKLLDDELAKKVNKVTGSRLLTEQEANSIAEAVTRTVLEDELSKKVDAVPGAGLITDSERTKLDAAVDSDTLSAELVKKVDKVEGGRLITNVEVIKLASAVTPQELEDGLATKVSAAENQRLITEEEANRLASAVISGDLKPYSLKNTGDLEEAVEVPKEEKKYIKFFDEAEGIEKKISMSNFILGVTNPVYPTARTLVGEKNGINETFTSEYNYIAGSEKLNINGSIYYPNSGFYMEDGKIILSGAPIPESGDFMFLEAIYLD